MESAYSGIFIKRATMRYVRLVLLFLLFFSCRGKIQENKISNRDTNLKILIWGVPYRDQQIAMELAAKNFGIEYFSIGGCVISKNSEDSANKINEQTFKVLQAKFGKDWEIQLEKTIRAFMDSISQARLDNDSSKVLAVKADGITVDISNDQIAQPPTKRK
jgi:hypothetical protein